MSVKEIFDEICKKLPFDQWQVFAMALELDLNIIMKFQKEEKNIRPEAFIMKLLQKWKEIKNTTGAHLISLLVTALKKIDRYDIVEIIQNGTPSSSQSPQKILQDDMKEKLRKNGGHLQLPRSLWLKKKYLPLVKMFVEFSLVEKNEKGFETNPIKQEEIFDIVDNRIPRRILIEGHPGYGKTTFIAKLLSDWSSGKNYISDKFDLVFIIPLRFYKGKLKEHLLKQCEGVKGSDKEKLEAIELLEERVLILLDGLDEIHEEVMENLLPIILGKKYHCITLILTCRTGLFHMKTTHNEKHMKLENTGFEKHLIWDRKVQIKGFSAEMRLEFLQKYLNVEVKELENQLQKSNITTLSITQNSFYECPLFLLLLAALIQDELMESTKRKQSYIRQFLISL